MNYSLDPLHAITARPHFLESLNGHKKLKIFTIIEPKKIKINKDRRKKKDEFKNPYPISNLAREFKINIHTVVSHSRKVTGKGGFLTKDEYDRLKDHLSGIKIRRRMGRLLE